MKYIDPTGHNEMTPGDVPEDVAQELSDLADRLDIDMNEFELETFDDYYVSNLGFFEVLDDAWEEASSYFTWRKNPVEPIVMEKKL